MTNLPISAKSVWTQEEIIGYLESSVIPMRLACNDVNGFPLVCSLWFYYDEGKLWGASHDSSKIVSLLEKNPRCGFEIASNEQPYFGVRGQALATLTYQHSEEVLTRLTQRYLDYRNKELAEWLISRKEREFVIMLNLENVTSWDYRGRMSCEKAV